MQFVLGSRSPRRRELLESVVGADDLLVCPPLNSEEEGFEGLSDHSAIRQRLSGIVRAKMDQVLHQLPPTSPVSSEQRCQITADTIVVADDLHGRQLVLGQPHPDNWRSEVRDWMLRLYSARTHEVWTGIRVTCGDRAVDQIVTSKVRFCRLTSALVDHYIATEESVDKAGGYAVQGTAAAFVEAMDGSLTNIIGLPLMELIQSMESIGIQVFGARCPERRGGRTSAGPE